MVACLASSDKGHQGASGRSQGYVMLPEWPVLPLPHVQAPGSVVLLLLHEEMELISLLSLAS